MTEISQSPSILEAAGIALWEMPPPEPDTAARAELSRLASGSNDQAVGNNAVGDGSSLPDLGPLADFGTWESVASTIVHKAETISGFNPGSATFDPVAWNNFLAKFSTIPFFLHWNVDYRNPSISSLSLEKGVNAVSDLIESLMTPQNYQGVLTSIKKMATLALENSGQTEKNNNQQVGVLSRSNGSLIVGAVRTEVAMQYKKGKGYEQLQQTLKVYRGYGVLDFDMCKRHADKLRDWDGKEVDDWVNDTASASKEPNDSPAWNQ
ncbi:hypothetical protein PV682_39075 [Streptomyces niveiscabiei]|uniref:hypothetical protein n=1 Tax=Streptomyces niveiscabiei TaxID=164115 RepID=UPI0029B9ADF5|nr:hypothetical protein [Streptomyces niveiscabiei]MDX3387405.1 hypothetical protein [Streptomyces niveiscabiei]